MHPAVYVLAWLSVLVVSQALGLQALVVALMGFLLSGQAVRKRWWSLVRRAKLLLLTLALVIAYSIPGLLWAGYEWAPSQEGVLAASEQVVRLLLLFAALAVVLERLSREDLLVALWSLLHPLLPCAWADQSVARLALVLRYVEDEAHRQSSWRQLISESSISAPATETVNLLIPIWRFRDITLALVLVLLSFVVGVLA